MTESTTKRDWDASWAQLSTDEDSFLSLRKRRFIWPYEGFILNTARLVRSGDVSPKTSRVLDFGCGHGRHAMFFAKSGFENVAGVDISQEAVDVAQAWANHEGVTVSFKAYDGVRLPYGDGEFDLVSCFGTFHHLPVSEQSAVAKEVARVVRAGGFFLWSEHSARTTGWAPGRRIGSHSIVIDDDTNPEHGLEQHYFTLTRCQELFPEFDFEIGATERLEGPGLDRCSALWNLRGRKR
jgi:2-polyprenyl-3-methyl-5-hydroxy-6-metoxy-1,4-benzoquinol methylase